MSRRAFLVLFGLEVLLAAVLRSVASGTRAIWYDDAFSLFLSRQDLASIVRGTAADTMPPLYYFLLHGWMAIGETVGEWRLLNILLSSGTIALVVAIGRRLFDSRVGLVAGLFAAISPLQIYQAQEIRMYSLLTLGLAAYVLAIVELWKGVHDRPWWLWAVVVAGGAIAAYSHNLAVFSLVAVNVFFLFRREWPFLRRLVLAQLGIAVLLIPWLLFLPGQIAKIQAAFWTPRPGMLEVLQAALLFHGYLPLAPNLQAGLLLLSLLAIALTGFTLVRNGREDGTGFLLAVLAVPPALLFAVSYAMRPVFVSRAFLPSALAYLILAAAAVRAAPKPVRLAIVGCMLASAAISLPAQYTYHSFPRSPFPEAAAYLASHTAPDSAVVHDNKLSYFPMAIYAPLLEQSFLPDVPASPNDTLAAATQQAIGLFPAAGIEAATEGAEVVYFVVFERAIEEYRSAGLEDHPILAWLRLSFGQTEAKAFGDLKVYVFTR
jgi:hypothetical protein